MPSMNRPWISLGACFERPVSFDRTKQQFETSNWKHRGKYEMWEVHKCKEGNVETGYGICPFGEEPNMGTRWNCWPPKENVKPDLNNSSVFINISYRAIPILHHNSKHRYLRS